MERENNRPESSGSFMTDSLMKKLYIKPSGKPTFPRKKKKKKPIAIDKEADPEFYKAIMKGTWLLVKKCCVRTHVEYSTKDSRWVIFCKHCELTTKRYHDFDDALKEWNELVIAFQVFKDL